MASVNKVIIVGNLGADPQIQTFQNGGKIATISVATTDRWTDKNTGEQREAVEWHRVVFNDRLAEIVAQYLRKGSSVYVEGSLKTRKWQDPQTGQDRYATEIKAHSMQMLGSRTDGGQGQQQGYNQAPQPQNGYPQGGQGGYGQAPQGQMPPPHPQYGYGQPNPTTAMQRPPQGGYTPPSPPMPQNGGYAPQGQGVDENMPF